MGFTPKHCQSMSKIYAICSLGMVDSICGEGDVGESKSKRRKRTTYLSDRINPCNDLARAAKEIRKWLTRGAGTHWKLRGVDREEWYAKSSCEFFEIADFYEEEASRASR